MPPSQFGWTMAFVVAGALSTVYASPEERLRRCACTLEGEDLEGRPVLQAFALALDRPGVLLTSLSALRQGPSPWTRLSVAPLAEGDDASGRSYAVTEVLATEPARDRALLRVPGLGACQPEALDVGADLDPLSKDAAATDRSTPRPGDTLTGLRNPGGYRSTLFRATLERRVPARNGVDLLFVRIADGAGAPAGFLLDQRHRLIGLIVPPPPGADPNFAVAVGITDAEIEQGDGEPGLDLQQAIRQERWNDFAGTPAGLLARALLLTRVEQTEQAIRLMNEAAATSGPFPGLLLERGALHYKIGGIEAAIADFRAATEIDTTLRLGFYDLGMALGTAARFHEAAEAFAKAHSLDPGDAKSLYQLVLALKAAGMPDRARQELDLLTNLDASLASELRPFLTP